MTALISLRDVWVEYGDKVVLEGFTHLIPFAAGHEIIRQKKRDLRLIGPISDILFDQLIGAGCVAEVESSAVSLG